MRFYLPRHHRRPLLFPPGLLALAGLLWLGCVALQRWEPALRQYRFLQLTLPMLPLPTNEPLPSDRFDLTFVDKFRTTSHWLSYFLTGKLEDRLRVTTAIHVMMADSSHRGRVSISLGPATHYEDLIFILDLMHNEKVQKYWLDIAHKPVTLYALTDIRKRDNHKKNGFTYDTVNSRADPPIPSISFWVHFDNWVTNFWHLAWLRPLLQPEWRTSVWLLAAIVALGGWRIVGPWRATQMP